jgi:hypothetical protein
VSNIGLHHRASDLKFECVSKEFHKMTIPNCEQKITFRR